MSAISTWSTTAASNNSASPNGFPEGMAPSAVNDSARETMAAIRTDYENREWRNWGHTVTRTADTTFTIASDVTAIYTANRPIRCTDSSTLYGIVASSSYAAPNTTVTVTLDSGALSASLSAVALGYLDTGDPIHVNALRGSGTMIAQNSNNVNVTGGSITGITDLAIADGGTGSSTAAAARTALGVAWELVGTVNPSAASSVSITGLSTATLYRLVINIKRDTGSTADVVIRFNSDSGSNYAHAALGYTSAAATSNGASTSDTSISLMASWTASATNVRGGIEFGTRADDTTIVSVSGVLGSSSISSPTSLAVHNISGIYDGASDLTSVQIVGSGATITGTASLFKMIG